MNAEAEYDSPSEDFDLEDFFTLDEIINLLDFILNLEPLILATQQLDEMDRLQAELQGLWRRFEAFLNSPGLSPEEAVEDISAEESVEDSATESAVRAARSASSFYCCELTRGSSVWRYVYNTSSTFAYAHCKTKQLACNPPRTMRLRSGRC